MEELLDKADKLEEVSDVSVYVTNCKMTMNVCLVLFENYTCFLCLFQTVNH